MSVYSPSTSDFNTPSSSSSVPFQTYKGISEVHQLNAFQCVDIVCDSRSTTSISACNDPFPENCPQILLYYCIQICIQIEFPKCAPCEIAFK